MWINNDFYLLVIKIIMKSIMKLTIKCIYIWMYLVIFYNWIGIINHNEKCNKINNEKIYSSITERYEYSNL